MPATPAPQAPPVEPRRGWLDALAVAVGVGVVCWMTSRLVLGESMTLKGSLVLFWPSAGLALAAALHFGWPALLGYAASGVALNLQGGFPPWAALTIALGSTLEVHLVRRQFPIWRIQHPWFAVARDHKVLILAGLWAAIPAALVGAGVVGILHRFAHQPLGTFTLLWWTADVLGLALAAPFGALLLAPRSLDDISRGRRLEGMAYLGVSVMIGHLVYRGGGPAWFERLETDFWPFLVVVWGAARFGHVGVTLNLGIAALQMLMGAQPGGGSPIHAWGMDRAVTLWLYLMAMMGLGHLVAALIQRREAAEAQARAQGERLSTFIRHLPAGLVVHAPDTRVEEFNLMACKLLGLTEAQLLGREAPDPAWKFYREDQSPLPLEEYPVMKVLATRQPATNLLVGIPRPGQAHLDWLMGNAYPLFDPEGALSQVVVVFVDVSEAIQSRSHLAESRRRLEAMMAFAKVGDWSFDLGRQRFRFSDPYLTLLGTSSEGEGTREMSPETFTRRFLAPQDAHLVAECLREMHAHAGPTFHRVLENEQRRADGTRFFSKVSIQATRNAAGEWEEVQGLTQDITELWEKEVELRRLALVAERTTSGVIITDPESRITWVNAAFTRITGFSFEEALGKIPGELLQGPGSDPDTSAYMRARIAAGLPFEADILNYRKGGEPYWIHINVDPLFDAAGTPLGFISVQTDITDLKHKEEERIQLERELLHVQKLESLGTLASGVAHDMNNVLGAIMGVASTLIHTQADEGLKKRLGLVLTAAERGRELVRNLNAYARKDQAGFQALAVNPLVEREASILRGSTFRQVEVHCTLAPDLPLIWADPDALGNALMNLCTNAIDAMEGQGRLYLVTERGADGFVVLSVTDTGPGMTQEVQARAMEPFFTTKPVGKGTGLGLAMVMGTAKTHGGGVDIDSVLGRGTTVRVRIPPLPPEDPRHPQPVDGQSTLEA